MRLMVLNGPNLNWLGRREPAVYGRMTLAEVNERLQQRATAVGCELLFFQSNSEGALIDFIQGHADEVDGVIINPGGLTHYGISLRDALAAVEVPVIEVHISNIYAREPWRKTDVVAEVAKGQIAGLGWRSYTAALEVLVDMVRERKTQQE
jgi:3-dehydroquinate dehydratase-2